MNWEQIEAKWAVMARRVRADVPCGRKQDTTLLQDRADAREAAINVISRQGVSSSIEITQKSKTETTL
ncbi:MAG: hypothetical protein ACOH2M_10145 [Cypionkella sp.]